MLTCAWGAEHELPYVASIASLIETVPRGSGRQNRKWSRPRQDSVNGSERMSENLPKSKSKKCLRQDHLLHGQDHGQICSHIPSHNLQSSIHHESSHFYGRY